MRVSQAQLRSSTSESMKENPIWLQVRQRRDAQIGMPLDRVQNVHLIIRLAHRQSVRALKRLEILLAITEWPQEPLKKWKHGTRDQVLQISKHEFKAFILQAAWWGQLRIQIEILSLGEWVRSRRRTRYSQEETWKKLCGNQRQRYNGMNPIAHHWLYNEWKYNIY